MYHGTVKWFNETKGFGFISNEDGSGDVILRLYEAKRLMLTESKDASSASLAVGYESPTQFNREYKRLFGEPPHRDVMRMR